MNQLKSPKTTKASSDILRERLKVIQFLQKSGRFCAFSSIQRQTGIPSPRLRDILNTRCEGYVARQGDHYGYSRSENKIEASLSPKPKPELVAIAEEKAPKSRARSKKQKLEQLRQEAYEQFKLLPNITDERAWLKAYQQHPDFF